jgi:RNA polymerase subunit RPABC4/transcription elongation factor Spt4
MQIIKTPQENDVETTCPECNTLFSYTWPEVRVIRCEKEAEIANYRRTGFLKGEYFVNIYEYTKPVIACPHCKHIINVQNWPKKNLILNKIGERILTKKEIKDWHCPLY